MPARIPPHTRQRIPPKGQVISGIRQIVLRKEVRTRCCVSKSQIWNLEKRHLICFPDLMDNSFFRVVTSTLILQKTVDRAKTLQKQALPSEVRQEKQNVRKRLDFTIWVRPFLLPLILRTAKRQHRQEEHRQEEDPHAKQLASTEFFGQ